MGLQQVCPPDRHVQSRVKLKKMSQSSTVPQPSVPTILVSRPGIMRQSLQVSLAAHPDIVVLAVCGDGLTALSQLAQEPPRLLIIDSNLLDDEIEALISTVKTRWPVIFCVAVVQMSQREEPLMAVGADATIHRDSWLQHFPILLLRLMQNAEDSDT